MKGLVWAMYLMVQDPSASAASWAYTGVTYLNKQSCVSDAATFTKMPIGSKAHGVDPKSNIAYVCVLQPKPEHYKG